MQFKIPCETFARLAHASGNDDFFNCVRIEQNLAIATNKKIMAVQLLDTRIDGIVHIVVDNMMRTICQNEAATDGDLTVTVLDGIPWATAVTTNGVSYPGNSALFPPPDHDYHNWMTAIPESLAKENKGAISYFADAVANLGMSSPSGRFIFPKFIDTSKPTFVRDAIDPAWFGLFIPSVPEDSAKHATYPSWLQI